MSTGRAPLGATARRILEVFADAYPQSAHYRGGRRLRKDGWAGVFPRIETDVEATEEFLAAVDELAANGLVSVRWRRFREGSEVEALYLEDPEAAFTALGKPSPEAVRTLVRDALDEPVWRGGGELLLAVREHLAARLDARHPVALADDREAHDLAVVLRITRDEARGRPIRALSVRLFADSKRLERLLPLADRLAREATGEGFAEERGLARSYPEVSIALRGELAVGSTESRIWRCAAEPITLPATAVEALASVRFHDGVAAPAVLSVENKETFHVLADRLRDDSLDPRFRAIVYGGGHPHRTAIDLLARCADGGAALCHFGDLDPDGLLILTELESGLHRPVHPYLMDITTYRRYRAYGYRPPASRMELLGSSIERLPEAVRELARMIVAEGVGVEQEVIEVPGVEEPR